MSGFVVSWKCLRIRLRKTRGRGKDSGSALDSLNCAVCVKRVS